MAEELVLPPAVEALQAADPAEASSQWEVLYETTGQLPLGYDPSAYGVEEEYQQPTQQQLQQYAQAWEAAQRYEEDDEDPEEDDLPPPPPPEDLEPPPALPSLPPPISTTPLSPRQTVVEGSLPPSPAASAGVKMEGRLNVRSSESLPWSGWAPCALNLNGDILHYKTENGPHTGIIDLSKFKTIITKPAKDVPEGKNSFSIQVADAKFSFYAEEDTQYYVWFGVFQTIKKKAKASSSSTKKSTGGSSSKKPRRTSSKKLKKSTVNSAVLEVAKQRLAEYGKDVSRSTYRFLALLYAAQPTFINAIFAITQQADADKVAGYLARIFYFVDRAHYLIRNVTNFEVAVTQEQNTLFRSNSLASKIMTAYSRIVAKDYLNYILKPIIERVVSLGRKLEVQPDKLNEIEVQYLPEHMEHVKIVCQETLDRIKNSVDHIPIECREICNTLKEEVSRRFPGAVEISIAGYMFLRLINPALVVPDSIGIVPANSLTADNRRGLLVVSKILLNVANSVEFRKEEYMQSFNEWTRSRFDVMKSFYQQCAEIPANPPPRHDLKVEPLTFLEEVARLYKILYFNSEKLIQQLGPDSALAKEFKACIDGIGAPDTTNTAPPPTQFAPPSQQPMHGRASLSAMDAERSKRASVFSRLAVAITHFFRADGEGGQPGQAAFAPPSVPAGSNSEKRASFNV